MAALATSGSVEAARWSAGANISPSVTYTDNVCLSKNNKQGDWVGTLTPSGTMSVRGAKASLNLSGSVQLNSLTNSALNKKGCNGNYDDREQYSPQLRGAFRTVVIPQWMDLNIQARANQNEVTSRAAGGGDDLNRTGNTNTYYRYSISPTVNRRFKDWVKVRAQYTWDEQFNSTNAVRDSHRHRVVTTVSNASPSQWSRALDARWSRVEYGENFNGFTRKPTELASARLRLAYRFSRRWAVNGYIGEEWNDFATTLNGDKDGNAWDIGVAWTPTDRTAVNVGQGDRFFGDTPRVNIRHSHKRNRFSANYSKKITFERDIRTEDQGGFPDNIDNPSALSNGPLLDERLALGWGYTGRDFSLSMNGNYSEQTRSEDGEKSVFKNVNLTYSPILSSRYSVAASLRWSEDEPRGRIDDLPSFNDRGSSETWGAGLTFSRSFNNRFRTSVSYNFTDRQGNSSFNEYQENRVTITLGIAL